MLLLLLPQEREEGLLLLLLPQEGEEGMLLLMLLPQEGEEGLLLLLLPWPQEEGRLLLLGSNFPPLRSLPLFPPPESPSDVLPIRREASHRP
jgi:hypothetical protein